MQALTKKANSRTEHYVVPAAVTTRIMRGVVRRQDEMPSFQSNEEYFQAVEDLIARLEFGGHQQAADGLRDGYQCLNGLTDGWALFLASVEAVEATQFERLSREDQQAIEAIRAAAHKAVYRQ